MMRNGRNSFKDLFACRARSRAPLFYILKGKRERNAGPDHSSVGGFGFSPLKASRFSIGRQSRNLASLLASYISDPLVPRSPPLFTHHPCVLLPLTLTISFSTDLLEPLGESLLRFCLFSPSPSPPHASIFSSHRSSFEVIAEERNEME